MSLIEKYEHAEKIGTTIHHLIIVSFVIHNFTTLECNWFTNDVCFMTVKPRFVKPLMIACAHFVHDMICMKFYLKRDIKNAET